MPALKPEHITYTPAQPGEPQIVVTRLTPEEATYELAERCLSICTDAFEAQLEPPRGRQLHSGTIRQFYQPEEPDQIKRRAAEMSVITASAHSSLWLARHLGSNTVLGYSHFETDNRRIKLQSIVVDPARWQQDTGAHRRGGVGRYLLHAPLTNGGYSLHLPLYLSAFGGSPVNEWYERIGFAPSGEVYHGWYGDSRILLRELVSLPGLGAEGVADKLEARYPELHTGITG